MMKKIKSFCVLLLIGVLGTPLFAATTTQLYVGGSAILSCPKPPRSDAAIYQTAWSSTCAYISISQYTNYGAQITVTDYFTETGEVRCDYYYYWYNNGVQYTNHATTYYLVKCNPVTVTVSPTSLQLNVGNGQSLNYSYSPSNVRPAPTLRFTSSNTNVATINSSGYVRAESAGNATITILNSSGPNATCYVNVVGGSSGGNSGGSSGGSSGETGGDNYSDSGTCGSNLTWRYANKTLTISGTGIMQNYGTSSSPWKHLRDSIETIIVENGVTSIGKHAFCLCRNLVDVTIANTVTSIGEGSFCWCDSLSVITIPSSVTTIGTTALVSGRNLTRIDVEESNQNFCSQDGVLFDKNKSKLLAYPPSKEGQNYVIPNSVTSIGDHAFVTCSGLTSITIPNSVTFIGEWAFAGCSSLISINIPNSVTKIEGYAFENCSSLTSITIPNSVTELGKYAFDECQNLKTAVISNNITTLKNNTFFECTQLENLTLGASLGTIENYCFSSTLSNTIHSITCYSSVPPSVDLHSFESIYWTFPSTCVIYVPSAYVNVYRNHSFWGNGNIQPLVDATNITFASSSISLQVGETQTLSPTLTPANATSSILWSSSDESIATVSSSGVVTAVSVGTATITATTSNGKTATCNVTVSKNSGTCGANLTWVYDENSHVLTISGVGAMNNYSGVNEIPWYLYHEDVTSIVIEQGVTSIGDLAFNSFTSLLSVSIPNSVTRIGEWAFASCVNLLSITIPNSVTFIGETAFGGCESITTISLPNSISTLQKSTFLLCTSLQSINLPNNLVEIGDQAFGDCSSLTSISIPSTVNRIDTRAFSYCTSLSSITNHATTPQSIVSSVFTNVDKTSCVLYVPFESLAAYQAASIWNEFVNIQPIVIASGTCGTNLNWVLSTDSIFTIRGTGTMTNYTSSSRAPWYNHRQAIKSIVIEEGVTGIGNYAFYNCSKATTVTIPNSVTSIGNSTFLSCNGLTKVYITDIAKWCGISFGNSSSNPLNYAHDLYLDNQLVTNLVIPDGVTEINSYAFYKATCLTSVTILNSVTNIGSNAFYGCSNLVTITNKATTPQSIVSSVFTNVDKTSCVLYVPSESLAAYQAASIWNEFANIQPIVIASGTCGSNLNWVLSTDSIFTISGTGTMTDYELKTLHTAPWYNYLQAIKSIVIEEGVTGIGANVFFAASSLTSLTISKSVTSIGGYAFYGCSHLVSITNHATTPQSIVSSVFTNVDKTSCVLYVPYESLAAYQAAPAWKEFANIQPIVIASGTCGTTMSWELSIDSVLIISGTGAMTNYTSSSQAPWYNHRQAIKSIVIEEGVTGIGGYAFYGCSHLVSITNHATTPQTIDSSVFPNVDKSTCVLYVMYESFAAYQAASIWNEFANIQPIDIASGTCGTNLNWVLSSDSILTITGSGSMTNYTSSSLAPWHKYRFAIKSIVIEDGVTDIGKYAFYMCGKATVTIPNSVTSIGSNAFMYCNGLTKVYVSDIAKWCGISFGNSSSNPLNGARNLYLDNQLVTNLVIPDGVTEIKSYAFYKATCLTSVTILNSVISIGSNAFDGCSNLVTITNKATTPQSIVSSVFTNVDKTSCVLYVPSESLSAYQSAYVWRDFTNIMPCIASGQYGTNLGWELTSDSLLHITGIGDMDDFDDTYDTNGNWMGCETPWYQYADYIKTVIFPEEITSIGKNAFCNCVNLSSITIPNTVNRIGDYAFSGCTQLTSITIPRNVTSMGIGVFYGCSSITSVVWNAIDCPTYYDNGTYYPPFHIIRGQISSFVLGDEVRVIPKYLCYQMNNLEQINIPSSVIGSGYNAFNGCTGLQAVYISDLAEWCDISYENYAANPLSAAHHLYLNGAKLTDVTIPNGVATIKPFTFDNGSDITSVSIPQTVDSIGYNAFYGCIGLKSIENNALIPQPVTEAVFTNVKRDSCTLYVRAEAIERYEIAEVWKDFMKVWLIGDSIFRLSYMVDDVEYAYDSLVYKEPVVLIDAPVKTGYTFSGWQDWISTMPAHNDTIRGYFAINQYLITFMDEDGAIHCSEEWEYGALPTCDEPIKEEDELYRYTFERWMPDVAPVTGVATYTAVYQTIRKDEMSLDNTEMNFPPQKIIVDGQILILRGDKKYTIQGQLVQ